MRVIGTIRSAATERIEVEADTYEEARRLLLEKVPEGHDLIALRADRGEAERS